MRYLLFFLCSAFSGIFYLFSTFSGNTSLGFSNLHRESISGNLFIESTIFFLLGVALFLYFSKKKNKNIEEETPQESYVSLDIKEIQTRVTMFFKKYLYYIGFVFFYIALYLISQGSNLINFSGIILFLNVVIFGLFFLTNRFFILGDLLKINTILFSCIYIIFYIIALVGGEGAFIFIDFINSVTISILFLLLLGFQDNTKKKTESDPLLVIYFSFYILASGVFYINYILGLSLLSYCLMSFTLGVILFYIPEYSQYLKNSRRHLRYISLVFLYTSCIGSIIYTILYGIMFIPFTILITGIWLHYNIHQLYQNYISFFFSFFHFFFLFSYLFFTIFYIGENKDTVLISNFLILSFSFIVYTYFASQKYAYDTHAIHVFSYIVNVFGVSAFLLLSEFYILNIGVIFFIESLFVFLSYYKLNKLP